MGGDYLVDVQIYYNFTAAMLSDNVNDTINYAEAYAIVEKEMNTPRDLLERVAYCITSKLIERWPDITGVHIKVTKCNPPMGAECDGASVEMSLVNQK